MEFDQTVFCIAEDPIARQALTSLALSIGLSAKAYGSVDEFLGKLDHSCPGCLVLDMPATSGIELLEALAAHNVCLPTILIVGRKETATGALRMAAFDLMEKPFEADLLLECIQRAVRHDARMRVLIPGRVPLLPVERRLAPFTGCSGQ